MSTRRPTRRARARAALGCAALGLATIACGEDPSDPGRVDAPVEASVPGVDTVGHLGRVHLVIQPQPDELEPEPQLQLSARFVEYRGVSEDFVRARTNLSLPVWEQLVPGQCVASVDLTPNAMLEDGEVGRELSMLDAGDLRVALGGRELVAPLTLVPDILPWLSGVEYNTVDDRLPRLRLRPDGRAPVHFSADGSPDGGLDGFDVTVAVPESLELDTAQTSDSRLTVAWRPPGETSDTIVLRLQTFDVGDDGLSEPVGEELTCLVADSGRADLALRPLAHAGLALDAERLRVSASRFDLAKVNAGEFGDVEILVELRAQRTINIDPPDR